MNILNGFFANVIGTDFDLQSVNLLSITVRLGLAVLLGGIIGMERGANKHAAGFRTHILVCLGATLAMLTNQYVADYISAYADPTRLGAQVISGIGFLGVGTIIMSGKTKIRGLTTAAGLWASACVGLALGIGFYTGAVIAAFFIYIALKFFYKFEGFFYGRSKVSDIYVEIPTRAHLNQILDEMNRLGAEILDLSVKRISTEHGSPTALHINFKMPKDMDLSHVVFAISMLDAAIYVEEL